MLSDSRFIKYPHSLIFPTLSDVLWEVDTRTSTRRRFTMSPSDSDRPPSSLKYIRDQIKDLKVDKADKDVVKSEFRRVDGLIDNTEGDVDDLKAHVMTKKTYVCKYEGKLGEMNKSIESNTEMSKNAFKTASLASDRGFKILMGAVLGLVSIGLAMSAWAISVSHTADAANAKVQAVEAQLAKPQPAALPPQIIIASPEYLSEKIKDKSRVVPEAGEAVDLEGLLERALTNALEKQDPLNNL